MPRDPSRGFDATLPSGHRRRTGCFYTPDALVREVVRRAIGDVAVGHVVRVLDPACGDGRFLYEAARQISAQGGVARLTGVDIDLAGVEDRSGASDVEWIRAESLSHDWGARRFDVVVGNPPYLSQLATLTARPGGSSFGGGPYADAAADFLALAVHLAEPAGGSVGLVLPVALLTSRDAGPIRRRVLDSARISWFWWSTGRAMFDAAVTTCAIGLRRCAERSIGVASRTGVERWVGASFEERCPVDAPVPGGAAGADGEHWGWLLADISGVPPRPAGLRTSGTVGDRAVATANFRDQYYGLVGSVHDDGDGPALITTGLIDVAACHWGTRPARFAKTVYAAPRVERSSLAAFMQRWADRCLVPKVLLATQTRVLEAVADPLGAWLPAVPVVRVMPAATDPGAVDMVWQVAAVLTSPVASALVAAEVAGSGLSPTTVRVSQRTIATLAWPAGDISDAAAALREGDVASCGRMVDAAYGVADEDLWRWWWRSAGSASPGRSR